MNPARKGLDMKDWDSLLSHFRDVGELTYHLEIMSRLRLGLNVIEAGESFAPLAITDIQYLADGIRGQIYCRHDKRTYEVTLKVLSEPLSQNAGADTRPKQQGENQWA